MQIEAKLEHWKNSLLDLSKRNCLISCPLPKDGKRVQRHSLFINAPSPVELWSTLVDRDGQISFPVPLRYKDDSETDIQRLTTKERHTD